VAPLVRQTLPRARLTAPPRAVTAVLRDEAEPGPEAVPVQLRLRAEGAQHVIVLNATNSTDLQAFFAMPASVPPGRYGVSLRTALTARAAMGADKQGWVAISWFQSKKRPRSASWGVISAGEVAPLRVVVPRRGLGLNYRQGTPTNATDAIDAALRAVRA
jgi:hypothetical protein